MSGDLTIGLATLDNSSDSLSSDWNLSVSALPNSLILGKAGLCALFDSDDPLSAGRDSHLRFQHSERRTMFAVVVRTRFTLHFTSAHRVRILYSSRLFMILF